MSLGKHKQYMMKKEKLIQIAALALSLSLSGSAFAEEDENFSLESAREMYASGAWETAKEAFEEAYEGADKKSVLRSEAALELATLHWEQGEYGAAERYITESIATAKALKLNSTLGRLMLIQGHIEASLGKLRQAETTLKVCNKMAEDYKDIYTAALCRIQIQFVQKLRGLPMNEGQYQKDLALLRNSDRDLMIGTALAKGSDAFIRSGEYDQALNLLNQAQARYEAAGSTPAQARNKLRRAQLYQTMGRWADSAKDLSGLEAQFRSMKNRPSLVTYYALAGRIAANGGNKGDALKLFEASVSTAKSVNSPQMIANSQLALCEFHAEASHAQALGACAEAEKGFRKAGIPDLATRAKLIHARMLHNDGQHVKAREGYMAVADDLKKRIYTDHDRRNLATVQANLCQVELLVKSKGTLQVCRDALKTVDALKSEDKEISSIKASTHYAAGIGANNLDELKQAKTHFKAASEGFEKVNDELRAADAYLWLGRVQARTNDDAAQASFQRLMQLSAGKPELKDTRLQGYIQLSQWMMEKENWSGAEEHLKALVAETGSATDKAWGHHALARVLLKKGDRQGAITELESGLKEAKSAGDKELTRSIEESLKKFKN